MLFSWSVNPIANICPRIIQVFRQGFAASVLNLLAGIFHQCHTANLVQAFANFARLDVAHIAVEARRRAFAQVVIRLSDAHQVIN